MTKKKRIRVLLVDDEERFRTTTEATLKTRDFEVKAVARGAEAIEEIRNGNIDVVVLDVKMPGMDGNEALRKMKVLDPDLEVIMLTGHGTVDSALRGWEDEVFAYITKPCDIDILTDKIRDAFTKKKGLDNALWYSVWSESQPPGG